MPIFGSWPSAKVCRSLCQRTRGQSTWGHGSGECAPANSEITHPRPEVPPRKAVKSPPASLSEPTKPGQAEPPPKRGGSVSDVAGGDIPQPETALRPCRPMRRWGWLLTPKHPNPLVRMHSPTLRMQAGPKGLHPAKALWVAAVMGMGRGRFPYLPADELRAATIQWMGAGQVGV